MKGDTQALQKKCRLLSKTEAKDVSSITITINATCKLLYYVSLLAHLGMYTLRGWYNSAEPSAVHTTMVGVLHVLVIDGLLNGSSPSPAQH